MQFKFFCPTTFEIPRAYKKKTETFGMGIKRAKKFAEKLNESKINSPVVIFGSAGALDPNLKPGDFFQINEIHFESQVYKLNSSTLNLPTAKLFTSPSLLKTRGEKSLAHKLSGASLVDMEMGAIWKYSSEETRKNLIFIRTVIDHAEQDFPNFKSLSAIKNIFHLIKNWRIYLSTTSDALKKGSGHLSAR